ncbi:MAG: hypothetical protein PVH42_12405 [Desulfobacterales bacterium]
MSVTIRDTDRSEYKRPPWEGWRHSRWYLLFLTFDGFVKSLKSSVDVITAQAGIHYFRVILDACLSAIIPQDGDVFQ